MSEAAVVRVRVVAHGRVQQVGFRASCARRVALDGRVAGFVGNRPDGAVEAEFEGPPDAVDALVAWFGTGPPLAEVTDVEVSDEVPTGVRGFRVG